jgi:hypothetical protein
MVKIANELRCNLFLSILSWKNTSESQIHAFTHGLGGFWQCMLPMVLQGFTHNKKTAILK